MTFALWILLAACALCCYTAACNIALKLFNKARLAEMLGAATDARRFRRFMDRLPKLMLITGTLRTIFNLVILLAALLLVEDALSFWKSPDLGTTAAGWRKALEYALAFLASGVLASIFGVAIPTGWARYHPERLLVWSMPLLNLLLSLLNPFANVLLWFDTMVRRMSGVSEDGTPREAISEEVLSVVAQQEQGVVDLTQKQMLQAVFEWPSITVGEVMTPRTAIHGLEVTVTLADIKEAVHSWGHSKLPIYDGNLDHILGILHARDLIPLVGESADPFDLRKHLRPAHMVPESKLIRDLLADFRAQKTHVAIVIDEYGGTAGLVTFEDIIEELVGDVQDDNVAEDQSEMQRIDGRITDVDARMHVDDLNQALGLQVPEDDEYETLGGFVMSHLGRIPAAGETFVVGALRFTVTGALPNKVTRVRIEKLQDAEISKENQVVKSE